MSESLAQRRRRTRIDRLYETARQIVAEKGLEGLTVQALADSVGKTPGALYRYFESRDALVSTLCIRTVERLTQVFDAAWGACPHEEMKEFPLLGVALPTYGYVHWSGAEPASFALIQATLGDPRNLIRTEDAIRLVIPLMDRASRLASEFDAAAARHDISYGSRASQLIILWSSVQGMLDRRKMSRLELGFPPVEQAALEAAQTLLVGWGAPREAVTFAFDRAIELLSDGKWLTSISESS